MGIPKRDFEGHGRDGFWLKSFQGNGNLGLKMRTLKNSSLYPFPTPCSTGICAGVNTFFAQQILQNEGAKRGDSLGQKLQCCWYSVSKHWIPTICQRVPAGKEHAQWGRFSGFLLAKPCMRPQSLQSCLTLGDPMDSRPPGSSVHGILQQEYWSGLPFLSPGDPLNPGIQPKSPALEVDSLPTEPSGKPS